MNVYVLGCSPLNKGIKIKSKIHIFIKDVGNGERRAFMGGQVGHTAWTVKFVIGAVGSCYMIKYDKKFGRNPKFDRDRL